MEEGKRQKQVAGAIQSTMNDIFLKLGLNYLQGGMISISSVKVTPDLLEARIYLSLFQVADQADCFKKIEAKQWDIKKHLQEAMKHQLRRIPVLHFYLDDTLDYVFKMEEILKKL
ncbi:MAG: ribosome-binding factor A [Sediminibacterium sp.]